MTYDGQIIEAIEQTIESLQKIISIIRTKIDPADPLIEQMIAQYGPMVSVSKAAELLEVSRVTIYNMCKDGRLTHACGTRKILTESIARLIYSR